MAELSGLVDLKQVCKGLVYKMSLDPYYYTKFYQFGIDGITQLKLYTLGETKVEKLEMDADLNTVTLPSDYLKFIDIGIPIGGDLWSLTRRNKMIDTTTLLNGQETYNSDLNEGDWTYYVQKGAGGRNSRYYTIDEKNRRIVISGIEVTTIWLVYISTGINVDEATYINRAVKPAIEAFVRWQFVLNDPKAPANKIPIYARDYRIQKNKLKRLKLPTLTQIRDSLAETFYRTTK